LVTTMSSGKGSAALNSSSRCAWPVFVDPTVLLRNQYCPCNKNSLQAFQMFVKPRVLPGSTASHDAVFHGDFYVGCVENLGYEIGRLCLLCLHLKWSWELPWKPLYNVSNLQVDGKRYCISTLTACCQTTSQQETAHPASSPINPGEVLHEKGTNCNSGIESDVWEFEDE